MIEIYADILIILNFIIDFFLLSLTAKLSNSAVKTLRLVLSSFMASLFSLYIFLPPLNFLFEMLLRLISSAVTVFVCFGFQKTKMYLKRFIYFYIISFVFAGAMIAVWFLFKPNTMALNNGVVYFNFSPLLLLLSTAVCYGVLVLFRTVFRPESAKAERMKTEVVLKDKNTCFTTAIDTGNSIKDPLSGSPVLIADRRVLKNLLGNDYGDFLSLSPKKFAERFRLIPVNTVSGKNLLPAVKCDKIIIKEKTIKNPLIAQSLTDFSDDYDAIINPEVLEV